jgi:hypothetical protein
MISTRFYYFEIFASILFLLLPVAMITGPFFPDLIISILAIYFFFIFFKNKVLFKNYFFILFIVFYILILIATFFSQNFFISIETSLPYLRFGLFVLTSSYLINKFPKVKFYFLNILVCCFLILILDGFYQFFNGKNILGYASHRVRIASFFGDHLILGSYMARTLPIGIAIFFLMYEKIKFKYFYMLVFLLSFSLIIISGERTSLAISSIFFLVLILFCNMKKLIKFSIFLLFVLILCSFINFSERVKSRLMFDTFIEITGVNDSYIGEVTKNKTQELTNMQTKKINNQLFFLSTAHESAWRISLKMFDSSKLTGIGPKMFRYKCNNDIYAVYERGCSTHPHNIYAQMLAEVGIFGFLFLLFLFFFSVFVCFFNHFFSKKKFLNNFQITLICSYIAILFPLFPSGNFFNNWLSVSMYLPLTFLVSSSYE